jgi:hypothetical protein
MSITRQQAEDRYGSTANVAAVLHIRPQTVAGWKMDKPIPATHQKSLAGWIDREHWRSTFAQIADFFPPWAGEEIDRRVRRSFTDAA